MCAPSCNIAWASEFERTLGLGLLGCTMIGGPQSRTILVLSMIMIAKEMHECGYYIILYYH